MTLFAKAAPPTYALPALSIATWPLATGLALLKLEKLPVEGLYLMTPAPAKVEMIKLPWGSNAKPLGWLAPAPKSGMLISASLFNPESYLITEFPPLFAK